MINIGHERRSQEGNVLFLILIAVALFAALSYVVTQSTRSGSGSTEREKNVLSSASMTQYPTALRTAIIRMVLAGISIEDVKFDVPASSGPFVDSYTQMVFHPQGGGATYQVASSDLSQNGASTPTWRYNAQFEVPGIGIDSTGGNDVIAFLPGVSVGVCRQVNNELGITDLSTCGALAAGSVAPNLAGAESEIDEQMTEDNTYLFPTTSAISLEPTGCTNIFNRQASGCFYDVEGARHVFYSVLLER